MTITYSKLKVNWQTNRLTKPTRQPAVENEQHTSLLATIKALAKHVFSRSIEEINLVD